jgi:hypothetical protein
VAGWRVPGGTPAAAPETVRQQDVNDMTTVREAETTYPGEETEETMELRPLPVEEPEPDLEPTIVRGRE